MKDKLLGGIMGLCVGDALGVPVEFKDRESLARSPVVDMRGYGTYNQPPGTWSDDTSLTLCLLDSLANGLDYTDIMQKFLLWSDSAEYTPHGKVFDIGVATRRSLDRFARGGEPLSCGGRSRYDYGNGSLMRILPLAFYLRSQYGNVYTDSSEAFDIIHKVSSLTHAHKRTQVANGIYLSVAERLFGTDDLEKGILSGIEKAKDHYERDEGYAGELVHYDKILKEGFKDLPEREINSSGYAIYTLEAAVWCLLNTRSYKDCVLKAVNLGVDTDTTAAVAGGLAGMHYGFDAIPAKWINQIARLDYIKGLCERIKQA
jgi:ADP-ribosylglycohydrolase